MAESAREERVALEERGLGLQNRLYGQLASGDVVVAHGGCAMLRSQSRRASPDERAASGGQLGAPVPPAAALDGCSLAQRLRRGLVCPAPLARGISSLDCGTQGCSQRVLLHAHALG